MARGNLQHNCLGGADCWIEQHAVDFREFDECFAGKIRMTDVDGMVERNGHLLLVEWKRGETTSIPTGQEILFKKVTKLSPGVQVFVIWRDYNDLPLRYIRFKGGRVVSAGRLGSAECEKRIFRWWYSQADAQQSGRGGR